MNVHGTKYVQILKLLLGLTVRGRILRKYRGNKIKLGICCMTT